jgi:peptidoglycan/LPS O-acetylase OafA/YrhL
LPGTATAIVGTAPYAPELPPRYLGRMPMGKTSQIVKFLLIAGLILALIGIVLFLGAYDALTSTAFLLCLVGLALSVALAGAPSGGRPEPAAVRSRSPPRS